MKPGNRHASEMVPNHTKYLLWKMRDWTNVYLLITSSLSARLQEGFFILSTRSVEKNIQR